MGLADYKFYISEQEVVSSPSRDPVIAMKHHLLQIMMLLPAGTTMHSYTIGRSRYTILEGYECHAIFHHEAFTEGLKIEVQWMEIADRNHPAIQLGGTVPKATVPVQINYIQPELSPDYYTYHVNPVWSRNVNRS